MGRGARDGHRLAEGYSGKRSRKLAFFTGRDQSQSLTGWWASQFGTSNHAAHGGFCSVNMAAAGLYSIGGSFWEFGEPDWEHTEYFMMFGVAEDHDSNPIKMGLGTLKGRGAKFVSVNPVKTGYSAIADEWVIRPGTDGLFVLSIVHQLLKARRIDLDYLVRYTNAPWLVIQDPGSADHGLFARDKDGAPLCFDKASQTLSSALCADVAPALVGEHKLADGRTAVPAFQLLIHRYSSEEYAPEAVAERCGVTAEQISRIADELAHAAFEKEVVIEQPWTDWAGRRHDRMIGRPVSMHAMRGISAHSNGFHTCRAIHVLQMLLGTIDVPGGFRYKPPFPKPCPPPLKPAGKPDQMVAGKPMPGPPLGFPTSPSDLLLDPDGTPRRIDKAYSWDAPVAAHGLMHMVINNAWAGDPYPVDLLFMYMANMAGTASMNVPDTIAKLTDTDPETGDYKIPKIIYSDAYASEMVAYADLVLPDTTYLERWDCISLLDRLICDADGAADLNPPASGSPDRDVRPFQEVLIELAASWLARSDKRGRVEEVSRRLSRLHREPRTCPRRWAAGWVPWRRRHEIRQGGAEPGSASALHRQQVLLAARVQAGGAILQTRQQGLSGNRGGPRADRSCGPDHSPAVCRTAANLPSRGGRPWRRPTR